MELDHEFTVPVPVDQAWSVLLDVERVASCMPGATLDSVEGGEYAGRMKVRVGAMTITYRGTARITSADAGARTVTIEAAAKEARGPGTAAATVQAKLHDEGGRTRVTVRTKLNVTGRPAQFGRNILAEVGAKLISRFARALAEELEAPGEEPTEPNAVQQAAVARQGSAEPPIVDQQGAEQRAERAAAQPPIVDQQGAEQAAEQAVPEPRIAEPPVAEPPIVDQQGAEQAAERAAAEPPVVDQQGAEQAAERAAGAAPAEVPVAAVPQPRPASPVESTSDDTPPDPIRVVDPAAPTEPVAPAAPAAPAEPAEPPVPPAPPVTAEAARPAEPAPPAEPVRPVTPIRRRDDSDDAIDLLEIAGPSLAKRAAPALGALVALLLVLRYLVRRRRR
ncbi:SRPBCC family protein [Spirillospora sp. NPDC050679]